MTAGFINGVTQAGIGRFSGCKTLNTGFAFTAPTVIQQSFGADYGVVAGNAGSRANLSDFTATLSNQFTVGTVDLTVVVPGTYYISLICTPLVLVTNTRCAIQIIKSGTVLGAAVTDIGTLTLGATGCSTATTATFVVGDTIDFRILATSPGIYNFINFDTNVIQIATGT